MNPEELAALKTELTELEGKLGSAYDEIGDEFDLSKLKAFESPAAFKQAQDRFQEVKGQVEAEAATQAELAAGKASLAAYREQAKAAAGTVTEAAQAGETDPVQEQQATKSDELAAMEAKLEAMEAELEQAKAGTGGYAGAGAGFGRADGEPAGMPMMRSSEAALAARRRIEAETLQSMKASGMFTEPHEGLSGFIAAVSAYDDLIQLPAGYGAVRAPYRLGSFKAVVNRSVSGSEAPYDNVDPRINLPPRFERTLLDILPKQTITRGTNVQARIIGTSGRDGAADAVGSGAAVPETSYQIVRVEDEMEFISEFSPITLNDLYGDSAIYDSILEHSGANVELDVESQAATGNGTDPQLKGILGYRSSWGVGTMDKATNDSKWQALVKGFWKVYKDGKGAMPTHIVLHSDVMSELMAETGKTGQTGANASDNTPIWLQLQNLFGGITPFVVNNSLHATDADIALIGDFRPNRIMLYDFGEMVQELQPAVEIPATPMIAADAVTPARAAAIGKPVNARNLVIGMFAALIVKDGPSFTEVDLSP